MIIYLKLSSMISTTSSTPHVFTPQSRQESKYEDYHDLHVIYSNHFSDLCVWK